MNIVFGILLIISFSLFTYIALRDFKFSGLIFVALLPTYLIRFSLGPIPTTALEIFALILICIWLYKKGYKSIPWNNLKKWRSPIFLLLAAASFGVVVAPDAFKALGIWKAYYIEPIMIGLVFISTYKKKEWRYIFAALSTGAMLATAFGIVQYFSGVAIPAPWDTNMRITGFFEYPNALGLFLAPICGIAIVMLASKERFLHLHKKYSAIAWMIVAMICGVGIVLAQTEAAFIAIPTAIIITLLVSPTKKRLKWRIAIEALLIFILAFFTLPVVREKVLLQDYSGQVRLAGWSESLNMLINKPIFGAGLNGHPEALAPYHDATLYEIFQYPHNLILNFWSELGILGVLALIWIIVLFILESIKQKNSPEVLAIFAALVIMLIHGLVDVPFFKNDLAMMTSILISGLIIKR